VEIAGIARGGSPSCCVRGVVCGGSDAVEMLRVCVEGEATCRFGPASGDDGAEGRGVSLLNVETFRVPGESGVGSRALLDGEGDEGDGGCDASCACGNANGLGVWGLLGDIFWSSSLRDGSDVVEASSGSGLGDEEMGVVGSTASTRIAGVCGRDSERACMNCPINEGEDGVP